MTPLLKKIELALELGISTKQIERLMREGLPFIPFGKRIKRYRKESVENWLLSRESCLSAPTKKAAGTSNFVSSDNAYTAACLKAAQRKTQKTQKQRSDNLLSLVPSQPTRA